MNEDLANQNIMVAAKPQTSFAFTNESIEELKQAREIAMISKVLGPLDQLVGAKVPPTRTATEAFISSLNQKLNMDAQDTEAPLNPVWVMQKHMKMLPPLEHYMRPTYYDVIYL
jgi:hypothetical protein